MLKKSFGFLSTLETMKEDELRELDEELKQLSSQVQLQQGKILQL
jgi:hypothetical protein